MRGTLERTVDAEANSIRLQRDTHKGAFLLVEGISDRKFYSQLVDEAACIVKSLSGKPSSKIRVIKVLTNLENSGFKGVLAIVDADFDRLLAHSIHQSPNLFRTDEHDLEAMLIKSPAFDQVLAEFCSETKVTAFSQSIKPQDIKTVILTAGLSLGYLRWISQRDELHLTFNGIAFPKFIDKQSLHLSEPDLIAEVQKKSNAFSLSVTDIQQWLNAAKCEQHDMWQVCCGHDLVNILSIGLRQALGSQKASDVEVEKLERCLRLAYERAYWLKTQLYTDICEWEKENPSYSLMVRCH